jgi:23S rRNA pseudouridine1911/1915/1917 synthase
VDDRKSNEPDVRRPEEVPPDAILRVFRVPPESSGMRLDRFVQSQLRNTSRTRARLIVEHSAFAPDGRRLGPNTRVRAEDRIALWRPAFEADEPEPELAMLHRDEHLLVLDKPPLITVHPTARYHKYTVLKRLEAAHPGQYFSLVHRLDRETSGILLVALSPQADRAFKRLLEDRAGVDKTYLAITWGVPPDGPVELPLEADPMNPLRVKMRVALAGQGLRALTTLRVRETRHDYALVECQLHTGRQHQIRVHLKALGCPVVGDKLYGPDERMLARAADDELTDEDRQRLELERHALHAHRYRLRHAITGEDLDLVSPLPRDLQDFWQSLASPARRPEDAAGG